MEHYTRAEYAGLLVEAKLLDISGKLPPRCDATIKVDDEEFAVTAYGELAEELAAVEKDTLLILKGKLKRITWETGEFQKRERIVLVAKEMMRFRKKVKLPTKR